MTIPGGWTEYRGDIPNDVMDTFNQAFEGFVGVHYIPVAYAQQVTSGMNYSFFCNASGVYPHSTSQPSTVDIYKPLEGNPEIKEIKIMDH